MQNERKAGEGGSGKGLVYDYIVGAMPQFGPGTLTADETYAVDESAIHDEPGTVASRPQGVLATTRFSRGVGREPRRKGR